MSFLLVDAMRSLSVLPRVLRLYPSGHERVDVVVAELRDSLGAAVPGAGGMLRFEVVSDGVRADGEVFAGAVANRLRDLFASRGIAGLEFVGVTDEAELRRLGGMLSRRSNEIAALRAESGAEGAYRILWAATPASAHADSASDSVAGESEWADDGDTDSVLPDGWRALPAAAATRALDASTLQGVAMDAARNRIADGKELEHAVRIAASLVLAAPTSRERDRIREGFASLARTHPAAAGTMSAVIETSDSDISRRLLRLLLPVLSPGTVATYANSAAPESHEIPLFLARCRDSDAYGEILVQLLVSPPESAWTPHLVRAALTLIADEPERWTAVGGDELLTDPVKVGRLLDAEPRLVATLLLDALGPDSEFRRAVLDTLGAIGTDAAFLALAAALDVETALTDGDVLETLCRFRGAAAGDYLASLVEEAPTINGFMTAMRGLRLSRAENARAHVERLAAQRRAP